jgi:hypothetical protein
MDAKVSRVIITKSGHLSIPSGNSLEVSEAIANEGIITLENTASILQTNTGINANSGTGTYEVKREGNNSSFSYNIWSSPIKEAELTTVFSSSNPCDIWTFGETNQSWLYDYATGYTSSCYGNTVNFSSSQVIPGGDGNMDVGRGYFVPGATLTTRSFTGQVNNGDLTIPIATTSLGNQTLWDNDDWNLVGNPYPSALDVDAFLQENSINNSRIQNAVYFWDAGDTAGGYNQHSDYATYNGLGGVNSGNTSKIPSGQIGSGQGFWVYANSNTDLVFNNAMRTGQNDQFFKTKPQVNRNIWVSFSTPNNYTNNILMGYNETSTDQIDANFDAHKLEGSANVRFSSLIDSNEFSIQAFKALQLGESKSIPLLVFSADSGIHTFSNYKSQNIPKNVKVYLKDNGTGLIHDLSISDYQIHLNGNQTLRNRFELVFENTLDIAIGGTGSKGSGNIIDTTTTVTGINDISNHSEYILKSVENGYILENLSGIIGTVQIIDISGKVLWTSAHKNGETALTINLSGFTPGIYLIDLIEQSNHLYSRKILKN